MTSSPILVGYDGSEHAKEAIAKAGSLFPGQRALILSVFRSAAGVAPAALGAVPTAVVDEAMQRLDEASRAGAEKLAQEGAQIATEAGLEAEPRAEVAAGSTWVALRRIAEEERVGAVVVGSRGLSPLKEFVLGSTSAGLAHHCARPVLIVRREHESSTTGQK